MSYDFGDIDGEPDPDDPIPDPDEDDGEVTPEPDPESDTDDPSIVTDDEVTYLDESDEEEYPLETELEDDTDDGYDFNELSMIPFDESGRYPIGLANTPNGSAVGYVNSTMIAKINVIMKDNRIA